MWSECRACHRPLRNEEARALGYGSVCARKRGLAPKARRRRAIPRLKPATVPPAPDTIPGQEALDLFHFEPTLDSI